MESFPRGCSADQYREVGIVPQFQDQMGARKCMASWAFIRANLEVLLPDFRIRPESVATANRVSRIEITQLLQSRVFRLGLLEMTDAEIGLFPERQ